MLFAAVAFGLLGTGGTYAYLNASAMASPGATLSAGTATLSASRPAVALTNLYPGQTSRGSFTVTNTGNVPLALSVASISGPTTNNGLTATLASGACPGTGSQVSAGNLGVTVATGASTDLCLTVSMPTTAPVSAINLTTGIVVTLTGTQA